MSDDDKGFRAWLPPEVGPGARPRPQNIGVAPKEKLRMPTADEIEAIRQAAQEEGREEGRVEGKAEGYEQGYAEGMQAATKEIDERLEEMGQTISRLEQIIQGLDRPFTELDEEVESSLVNLAIALARQLVRREIKLNPGHINGVVREALSALPVSSRDVRVHLHPDDVAVVEKAYGQAGRDVEWRIETDATLARGGCRVTSRTSRIDATLERRLASIIAPLLNEERELDIREDLVGFSEVPEEDESLDGQGDWDGDAPLADAPDEEISGDAEDPGRA